MPSTFYRPARTYPPRLPSDEMVIMAPPTVQQKQGGFASWLQYLLPVVGGLGSMVFFVAFGSKPIVMIAIGIMVLASVGMGVTLGVQQRVSYKRQQKFERTTYLNYLTDCRTRLRTVAAQQRQVRTRLYPTVQQLETDVQQRNNLWERRLHDRDFLSVRLGTGPTQLCSPLRLDLGSNPMVRFVPELRSQAESLVMEYSNLDDMPVAISLREVGTLAINGRYALTHGLMHSLLCQIVAFHAPEDVRCAAYFPPERAEEWEWLKWLPHTRRLRQVKAEKKYAPDPLCLLADTPSDFRAILVNQIKPELDRRRRLLDDQRTTGTQAMKPHMLVLLDGFNPNSPLAHMPEMEELLRDSTRLGVTVICLVEREEQEPSVLQARITVSDVGWFSFKEIAFGGHTLEGLALDSTDISTCDTIARSLTPLTLADKGAQQDLSHDVRLLDLLQVHSADAVHLVETQQTQHNLLQAAIGRRADGEPLLLDLKEAAEKGMGPHGLIVGATGSGKSELLRTIVTSLAITHSPDAVNFVLVDFKGGASFADFAPLPHVAGVITNLQSDASLVDRAYASLLGEQQRRQRMLHDAGNLDNIKEYQAKWRTQPAMEPMPHLLIIVDEFAELIVSRPDFLDLFITIGRVGRSLGLHLLLATQRIDEGRMKGLEGHLRYRICLRTFSAPESSAVLGNPDAYYLPSSPGVGYFKVDTDTYSLFKTALISVPYVPPTEQVTPASLIRTFDATGTLLKYEPAEMSASDVEGDALSTEMDVVLERLARPVQHVSRVHQVWLPPLPKMLPLDTLLETQQKVNRDGSRWLPQRPFGTLCVPIGLLDKPLEQAQEPLVLDFSGSAGHLALVGAPQSGKSTLLRTLMASFIATHSPRDVQLYGLDFGGGLLRVFESAPHVGAICGKAERDKVRRLVRQMQKIIEDREFLFRERGIDSMATFRLRRQAGELNDVPFGDVFLIIDNFAQFQQDFELLESDIVALVATGLTYGVHVVLAANRWAEIRSKIRDNIGRRLELRLNDPIESEVGKLPAAALPVGVPGRGLTKEKLQFQAALPLVRTQEEQGHEDFPVQAALTALVQRAKCAWRGEPAPPIRMLPTLVTWQDIAAHAGKEQMLGVPLGLEEFRLNPVYIDLITAGPHFVILGDTECGKSTVLRAWMHGLEQRYTPKQVAFAIVDYRKTLLDFAESPYLLTYAHNSVTLKVCIDNFKVDLEKRVSAHADVPIAQLRKQQRWDGCHFFLFVDDYDTIVTPTNNPLTPLLEMLLAGRDIGFHLVITRRAGGAGRVAFEPVMQRLREMGSAALMMSGDPQEGKLFHGQAPALLPPGRGYLVQRNQPPTLIQVVCAEPQHSNLC